MLRISPIAVTAVNFQLYIPTVSLLNPRSCAFIRMSLLHILICNRIFFFCALTQHGILLYKWATIYLTISH